MLHSCDHLQDDDLQVIFQVMHDGATSRTCDLCASTEHLTFRCLHLKDFKDPVKVKHPGGFDPGIDSVPDTSVEVTSDNIDDKSMDLCTVSVPPMDHVLNALHTQYMPHDDLHILHFNVARQVERIPLKF